MTTLIIGILCFCAGTYCFLLKEDCLLGLLIIAGVFQAASGITVAGRGIQPYYIIACFIIARAIANHLFGYISSKSVPQGKWLLIFGAIAIISAFSLPFIFRGIPVYEPKVGIDDGSFIRPPLVFGWDNIGQAGFLAVHIATVYASLSIRTSLPKTRKAYLSAFYLAAFFVFLQSACQVFGISALDTVLHNNYAGAEGLPTGTGGTRNPGPFSEQSIGGAFFLMYCVGFLAQYLAGMKQSMKFFLALVTSGLVASTGSIFSFSLCAIGLCYVYSPLRFPWYLNTDRAKRIGALLLLGICLTFAVLLLPNYRDALLTLTLAKGDSSSFINRTTADIFSLNLTFQTYGMGVGLGSNRASSMLTTLLSNVGIAGTFAFFYFYLKLFSKLSKEYTWLRWAGFAILINMCLDIADITVPVFWLLILLAVQARTADAKMLNAVGA